MPGLLGVRSGDAAGATPARGPSSTPLSTRSLKLGVHHIEIPAIPERVRCAIQDAPRFQAIEARHLGVQIDAYDQCQAGRVCPRGAWQRQSVRADDKKEGCLAMFPATSLLMRRQGKIFPCQASPERGEMDV